VVARRIAETVDLRGEEDRMSRDPELDEVDRKIEEAKEAARDEEQSAPVPEEGDQPLPSDPVYRHTDEGFSPT
jgi:hypothetical protein